jgi:hypothetical protein
MLDQESILFSKERKGSENPDSAGAEGFVCGTYRTSHL